MNLSDLSKKLGKSFGIRSGVVADLDGSIEKVDVIPTGIDVLDNYVLGIGGLPVGRIVEVYSAESGGKTSFALFVAAAAQKNGHQVIWVETERTLTRERCAQMGVDPDKLFLIEPDHMEHTVGAMEQVIDAIEGPALLVWDSLAATPTKGEVEEGLGGKDAWDTRAKTLSKALRILVAKADKKKVSILIINQTRQKVGVVFGSPDTTPGGMAVKFAASIRLQLFPGQSTKDGEEKTGRTITFSCIKNKLAPPLRKARVRFDFEAGFDNRWATVELAKVFGVIPKSARLSDETVERAKVALEAAHWRPGAEAEVSEDENA